MDISDKSDFMEDKFFANYFFVKFKRNIFHDETEDSE